MRRENCSGGMQYLVYQKMTPAHCFLLALEAIKWPFEIYQSMEKYIYFQTWLFGVTGKAGNGKQDRNGNGNGK